MVIGGSQDFSRWWARELAWFVPDALKERGLPAARLLWLEVSGETVIARRLRRGKLEEVGRFAPNPNDPFAEKLAFDKLHEAQGRAPLGLCVASAHALRRHVAMPLAVRDDLDMALRFELDRQTPFRADEVYYSYRHQGTQDGNLTLSLAVLPKHVVSAYQKRLQEWGVPLHAIALSEQLGAGGQYDNFLPRALRPAPSRVWRWLYVAMALTTLALIGAVLALPIWQKRETAMALMPIMAKAERDAKLAAAVKDKAQAALAWHNFLIEKRQATPTAVAVIDEVTRLVPDHTWIESLEIRGGEITLQGESGAAAGLVNVFSKSALLGDANHKAPLVKIHDNRERFRLSVALLPMMATDGAKTHGDTPGHAQAARADRPTGARP